MTTSISLLHRHNPWQAGGGDGKSRYKKVGLGGQKSREKTSPQTTHVCFFGGGGGGGITGSWLLRLGTLDVILLSAAHLSVQCLKKSWGQKLIVLLRGKSCVDLLRLSAERDSSFPLLCGIRAASQCRGGPAGCFSTFVNTSHMLPERTGLHGSATYRR